MSEDGDETRRPEKPNDLIDEVECARVGEVESVESNTLQVNPGATGRLTKRDRCTRKCRHSNRGHAELCRVRGSVGNIRKRRSRGTKCNGGTSDRRGLKKAVGAPQRAVATYQECPTRHHHFSCQTNDSMTIRSSATTRDGRAHRHPRQVRFRSDCITHLVLSYALTSSNIMDECLEDYGTVAM
jgi:hypothetical protein